LSAQASLLDPRNRSATDFDKLLPRRARRTARVDADRSFGDWRIGASWVGEGARYDNVANSLRLGGYATLDLRAELAFARDWSLQASVRNAFDRDYETAAYYNQPGREFGFTLRWAPGT
jgi:vitamin B12 transporter